MVQPFPFQLIALVAGTLYGLLALTLWTILRRRHPTLPLGLWVGGALAAGLALVLLGTQDSLPAWLNADLAFACLLGSITLRILALRCELGRPLNLPVAASVWALGSVVYWLGGQMPRHPVQLALGSALLVAGAALFARHAAAIGHELHSRIGSWLSTAEAVLAGLVALRTAAMLLDWTPAQSLGNAWDTALVVCVAVLSALFGNLGYLGLVLDRSHAAQRTAIDVQWAERLRREAAEDRAATLRDLLHQRDELACERDHLLKLLAHEIRQPLHNASGALQAARAVLGEPHPDVGQRAADRLQRAQSVLADVRSVLDNTLAAASLLGGGGALYVPETPLAPLISQALGDLPDAQRRLVRVQWQEAPERVELEAGLVRLALRNLLRNAFIHGGPAVSVRIQFERQHTPSAVVISVTDDGTGPPPDWHPDAGATPLRSAGHVPAPRGLGLYIVREVMARHGGSVVLQPRHPHGLIARLVFPQSERVKAAA